MTPCFRANGHSITLARTYSKVGQRHAVRCHARVLAGRGVPIPAPHGVAHLVTNGQGAFTTSTWMRQRPGTLLQVIRLSSSPFSIWALLPTIRTSSSTPHCARILQAREAADFQ